MSIQPFKPVIEPSCTAGDRLVLVVGPSGSGKDTLMYRATRKLQSSGIRVHIARRWITRPSHRSERFISVTIEDFIRAARSGKFVLWWFIYGLYYGVPRYIEKRLCKHEIVLVNLSRSVLYEARSRYPGCKIVKVEVAPEEAERRVRSRGREQGAALDARLKRMHENIPVPDPDLIIRNVDLGAGVDQLVTFLRSIA